MKLALNRYVGEWLVIEPAQRLCVKVLSTKVTAKKSITWDTTVQAVWITYQLVSLVGMRIG